MRHEDIEKILNLLQIHPNQMNSDSPWPVSIEHSLLAALFTERNKLLRELRRIATARKHRGVNLEQQRDELVQIAKDAIGEQ